MIPLATSSQRVMPPKMLKRIAVDLRVGGDHLERVDDRVGLRAAAGVEEVGGLAAGVGDDVERRHAEPGAVAEDADVAVELDVGEALLLRHPLLRVLDRAPPRASASSSWRKSARVVDRHLGVERDARRGRSVTISGLTSIRVASLCVEGLVELRPAVSAVFVDDVLVDAGVDGELPRPRRRRSPRRARRGGGPGRRGPSRRSPRRSSRPSARASPAASSPSGRG